MTDHLANILNLLSQKDLGQLGPSSSPSIPPLVAPHEERKEGEWDPKATGAMPSEDAVEDLNRWPITSVPAPVPSTAQPVPPARDLLEVMKLNKLPSPFTPKPHPLSELDLLLMKTDPENKIQ